MRPSTSPSNTATPPDIRIAETAEDIAACFALMRQLRPHLGSADELVERWRVQQAESYCLMAAWRDGVPVALAGYRVQTNLVAGRFLYVDDLVTDSEERSGGLGQLLIERLRQEARSLACNRLVLDTPMSNSLGQRFYFRNGLLATAMHFSQPLP